MTQTPIARSFRTLTQVLLTALLFSAGSAFAQTGVSQLTTWTCAGSNCPWGASTSGLALVWPNDVETVDTRYDYTLNRKIYLPASKANGTIIWIDSGVATLYAGPSNASHRALITLTAGQNYVVSGLAANEVLSVQGYSEFTYQIDVPDGSTPPPQNPPPTNPPAAPTSEWVTWNCTSSPCDWGQSVGSEALVWPTSAGATSLRMGYTTSKAVYLPAATANRVKIWIDDGAATLYAGTVNGSARSLTTLYAGQSYTVTGLAASELLSVQGYVSFKYRIEISAAGPTDPPPTDPPPTNPPAVPTSEYVIWNCTSSPCDWGQSIGGEALVWPASASPSSARFGYTTSKAVYLPAATANRVKIWIDDGAATLYAGTANGSARSLTTLYAGQSYEVGGLATGELLSVQGYVTFKYRIEIRDAGPPPTDPPPTDPPPSVPTSQWVIWNCTSSPCDWGQSVGGEALVWPASEPGSTARFGYTTSKPVYLASSRANGLKITVTDGAATLYAGTANGSARQLSTVYAGSSYVVTNLAANELLSVQGYVTFKYTLEFGVSPGGPSDPPPPAGDIVYSQLAEWHCDILPCSWEPWYSSVIAWPSNTAYQNNARQGLYSRSVFTPGGQPLYPYMGSWADGCKVEAVSGVVLIIEWERGTDVWRSTYLQPGESHTIDLQGTENGAMIESYDYSPGFSVKLTNCNPQPLP